VLGAFFAPILCGIAKFGVFAQYTTISRSLQAIYYRPTEAVFVPGLWTRQKPNWSWYQKKRAEVGREEEELESPSPLFNNNCPEPNSQKFGPVKISI